MKIVSINPEFITFDNGNYITYDHYQDCCENNYADFEQLDDLAKGYNFPEELLFEKIENSGFLFGDSRRMFFVPCYSDIQNRMDIILQILIYIITERTYFHLIANLFIVIK